MYTLLELESKTFGELKKIGYELDVLPPGDRRRRQSWIDVLVNVKPPLLALLEDSPAAFVVEQVQSIIETVETPSAVEVEPVSTLPTESKFCRIVYPRPVQKPIAQAVENCPGVDPGVDVDRVQEPITPAVKTKKRVHEQIAPAAKTKKRVYEPIELALDEELPSEEEARSIVSQYFISTSLRKIRSAPPPARIFCPGERVRIIEVAAGSCNSQFCGSIGIVAQHNFYVSVWVELNGGGRKIVLCSPEKLELIELIAQESAAKQEPIEIQRQEPIENSPGVDPGVDVDRVQDIINETWNSWEKEYCAWLKNAKWCIHHGENKRIDAFLPVSKTLRLEGMRPGVEYCHIYQVSECTYDTDGSPLPVCSSLYPQEAITRAETSPGVEAEHVQDLPIESMFGRIAYPPLAQDLIAQNEEARPQLDRNEGANVHNLGSHPAKPDGGSSGAKTEAMGSQEGDRVLAVARDCETDRGRILPDQSIKLVNQAQEPIALVPETSSGVDLIDDELPECSNCFGDGYTEDEFGSIEFCKFCQIKTEPKLSRQKTQRAIGLAAKISLDPKSDLNPILTGIPLSDRFLARYAPPQSETLHYELTDGCRADTDGQLSLFEVKAVAEPEPPDPDDFESLDAFREAIARWDWEHPSDFDHCSVPCEPNSVPCEPNSVPCEPNSVHREPPDSDDFKSLDAFREAIARWEAQKPEPLDVSLDSMCEWAPCPHEWYEPRAENLPLKASSMIELPEQSQVMELLRGDENCSDTSEFFIPTFGSFGDRFKGRDEPPDTGIFARLPKPKPPTFPPQASQPKSAQAKASHLSPKTASWTQVDRASRKLFHCLVAGTNNQPARSPPGGDAMP